MSLSTVLRSVGPRRTLFAPTFIQPLRHYTAKGADRPPAPHGQQAGKESTPSATSAIAFKSRFHHPRRTASPYPIPPPTPSAEEAVNNILYNTPMPTQEPNARHVLSCFCLNEPGVISRISGVLAARNFNIDSLVGAQTEVQDLGRVTVVARGKLAEIEQVRKQLEDLVPVWAVIDYSNTKLVERELLLVKVSILGAEHLHEQMPIDIIRDENVDTVEEALHDFPDLHLPQPSASEALLNVMSHLKAITELTKLFQGRVLDISSDCVILEICAKPSRIDNFIKLVKPFGILEASRTGAMAMPRSPVMDHYEPQREHAYEDTENKAEMNLPPG